MDEKDLRRMDTGARNRYECFFSKLKEFERELGVYIAKHQHLYLWGAGVIGKRVKRYLEVLGYSVDGFLITSKTDVNVFCEGIPILTLNEIDDKDNIGIILSLSSKHQQEVLVHLHSKNIDDIFAITSEYYDLIHISQRMLEDSFLEDYRSYFVPAIRCEDIELNRWKNILLICIENIGDIIMYLPFVRELRRNCSGGVKITAVAQPAVKYILDLCPYVDKTVVYDPQIHLGNDLQEAAQKSLSFAEKNLRSEKYDVVFLQGWYNIHVESLFMAMFSKSAMRIGFSESNMPAKALMNKNFDKFLSVAVKSKSVMHEVERNLQLLKELGGKIYSDEIDFWIESNDIENAELLLSGIPSCADKQLVAVVPYANDPRRMWDKNNYLSLMEQVLVKYSRVVLLVLGGRETEEIGIMLEKKLPAGRVLNLAGKTSLGGVAAVLKKCDLYIGCNTGLTHIAAAWKVPVVEIICHPVGGDLLEYSSPARYSAWKTKNVVVRPQKPLPGCGATCYAREPHCINQITVDEVMQAVAEIDVLNT